MTRKKNVLLISPHSDARHNESRYVSPAPGIWRIAGFLNSLGHHAEAFDPNLYDINPKKSVNLETKLKERKWDIIGVSCLEETLAQDMENLYLSSKTNPTALIISGGIEAQYNYQTLLDKTPCTLVVLGEGEIPMKMICEDKPFQDIAGIVFKNRARLLTKENFEYASEQVCWEKINFEDYWDFYLYKYGTEVTDEILQQIHTVRIFSSNRCPFLCKFCTSTNQLQDAIGDTVKPFGISADKLTSLIKRVYESHPRTRRIYMTDDDFCLNRLEVIKFCKSVISKGLNKLSYMCFARITDLNDEVLSWMQKANFTRLNIGAESFSDNVLKEVGKKCKARKLIENLRKLKDYNIQAFITIILITPKSKIEDLELTINRLIEFTLDPFYSCGLALAVRPTKGSEFFEIYYDYETFITEIKSSKAPNKRTYKIKENKMIYAEDPLVKEIQKIYYNREQSFLDKFIKEKEVKHATYSNTAHAQLKLLQDCIDEVKIKNGIKKTDWEYTL